MRWVKDTFPPRARDRWLFRTVRLSMSTLAGMARTLVATGMDSEEFMFATTRAAAPRSGVTCSAAGSTASSSAGAGAAGASGAAAGGGAAGVGGCSSVGLGAVLVGGGGPGMRGSPTSVPVSSTAGGPGSTAGAGGAVRTSPVVVSVTLGGVSSAAERSEE